MHAHSWPATPHLVFKRGVRLFDFNAPNQDTGHCRAIFQPLSASRGHWAAAGMGRSRRACMTALNASLAKGTPGGGATSPTRVLGGVTEGEDHGDTAVAPEHMACPPRRQARPRPAAPPLPQCGPTPTRPASGRAALPTRQSHLTSASQADWPLLGPTPPPVMRPTVHVHPWGVEWVTQQSEVVSAHL